MIITKYELGVLFSLANANYRDLDQNDLDSQQFIAMCWAKAVLDKCTPEVIVEFPKRLLEAPEED